MTVLIEDSPRNLLTWIQEAVGAGLAGGAVIEPWSTPWVAQRQPGYKRAALEVAEGVRSAGGQVYFDPTTHALQMDGVGDFRFYDQYRLWGGPRGDLSTPAARREHLRLVFEAQHELGAVPLAPTVLLHHSATSNSQLALQLAEEAVDRDPTAWLAVAGTTPFWASGSALDAHVGALAQLQPAGWFLSVVRPLPGQPVEADPAEVFGLCRTVRALAEYAPVHISHGDLAGLPGVVAGATSVGSGWDQRQRVSTYASYAPRDPSGGGGAWYERPSYIGLLGSLKPAESSILVNQDPDLARRLGPPPSPGPKESYLHHLGVLGTLIDAMEGAASLQSRYEFLRDGYASASAEWPRVEALTSSVLNQEDWVADLQAGLLEFGRSESW